ncbi:ABC transporter permease [Chitinophaga sancti]|uniref:ABC transporter permease n=1 Tax=Chitinophaga sancti TaxID=1004 RepID=A0A1K1S9E8_9BACT|nr:ABC transporter permease [Chitinophaga sancti]WQD60920.1 ABC transporter permease [Chitinophaga sancti]WQG86952.1 ABC transporter permease [Chitinophaga sancti]SFW80979.1 duplicated orphan permease [Chitinophaga sancti]
MIKRFLKKYSILNIFGLAIGIICAGVIFLWVEDEVQFDSVNQKKDRLYAVLGKWDYDKYIQTFWSSSGALAPAMKADIPGVANTFRMTEGWAPPLISYGDKSVYVAGRYADPSVFNMLTIPFVAGGTFNELHSIVITEKLAKKVFGEEKNVVGKSLKMDNKDAYVVSGVIKDWPSNVTIRPEWIAPFEVVEKSNAFYSNWGSNSLTTVVELAPNANLDAVNKQLYNFVQQHLPTAVNHAFLHPMTKWRLYSDFDNGKPSGGRIQYVRMFTLIAWIILFIACINFMNLATAASEKRAREVGVRKVMGASKRGLILRFMGEAIITTAIACVLALVMIWTLLPYCNLILEKELSINILAPAHVAALLGIVLICGLVAGSYPALYLSSFNPVSVLKGNKRATGSAAWIRKGLVILQFTVSIVLIISTIIIYQQVSHVKGRDMGFDKRNVVGMNITKEVVQSFPVIKQDLLNTGVVEAVAMADHATIYGGNNTDDIGWEGKSPTQKVLISVRSVSAEYLSTMKMQFKEGRDFRAGDSVNVIITESTAKLLGQGSVIGKSMIVPWEVNGKAVERPFPIVGVVKDYLYGDMYGSPDPVVFFCIPTAANILYMRLKVDVAPEKALAKVGAVMEKDNPAYPFDYIVMENQFNELFTSETLINRLATVFAVIAILISCLGLFGLATYMAERRTREVGIRKVLGASTAGITTLLSKDFLKLVGIAVVLAFPLAWYAMSTWLQQYTYRVDIHWWVFVLAGGMAMIISLFTISFQSIRAALMDPVKSLRAE